METPLTQNIRPGQEPLDLKGYALEYTLQLPTDDQFLLTRSDLFDRIKGLLRGRASEEITFAEVSTGAENDLEHATALARQMVCLYGMSQAVGLMHCAERRSLCLPMADGTTHVDCSDDTAHQIDQEVKSLLDSAFREAKNILTQHHDQLEKISEALIQRETLDKTMFQELLAISLS
jgi:cell division protease FtsH